MTSGTAINPAPGVLQERRDLIKPLRAPALPGQRRGRLFDGDRDLAIELPERTLVAWAPPTLAERRRLSRTRAGRQHLRRRVKQRHRVLRQIGQVLRRLEEQAELADIAKIMDEMVSDGMLSREGDSYQVRDQEVLSASVRRDRLAAVERACAVHGWARPDQIAYESTSTFEFESTGKTLTFSRTVADIRGPLAEDVTAGLVEAWAPFPHKTTRLYRLTGAGRRELHPPPRPTSFPYGWRPLVSALEIACTEHGWARAGDIGMPTTAQALGRDLTVLVDAGLVDRWQVAPVTLYRPTPAALAALHA